MSKRFVPDVSGKRVIDTKTGEKLVFGGDDGTLTMLASFLYNSMASMEPAGMKRCSECYEYAKEPSGPDCPNCGGNRLRSIE